MWTINIFTRFLCIFRDFLVQVLQITLIVQKVDLVQENFDQVFYDGLWPRKLWKYKRGFRMRVFRGNWQSESFFKSTLLPKFKCPIIYQVLSSRRRWLLPGTWSHLWFAGVRECPPWCSIVGSTVTVHQFFCILHFCHTCSLCRVELVVQFPARGSTQVLLCLFPGVLWLWHFLYSVGPHSVPSLHIYTFVVSRAFMAGAESQAGDADSSRALGHTSGLQGSVNVHRGALLLVPQWQCISSFVFYILLYFTFLSSTVQA